MKTIKALLAVAVLTVVTGCTNYYRITDPSTGKQYFTTDYKEKDGATKFKDGAGSGQVTIQNSEVMKITKEQYESGARIQK